MKPGQINTIAPNDFWIIHREEIEIVRDGTCNVYALLDAASGFCFGVDTAVEQPSGENLTQLFKKAYQQMNCWPQQVWILKSDPFVNFFESMCSSLNLVLSRHTPKEMQPFVQTFINSFRQFNRPEISDDHEPLTQIEQEELDSFIPETYSPCPCASGKKFKFCCKKAFNDISFAMCAAEEGDLEQALHYMKLAESKVGRTAEICCRLAICWSFFDKNTYTEYLLEATQLSENHPRLNYILGIEAKENSQLKLAVSYYQKAIDNYPKSDKFHLNEAYNNLGTALFDQGEYSKAKAAWEKGFLLLPTDRLILKNLFNCIYENTEIPEDLREISPFVSKQLDRQK